jgi:hypothetical protein
MVAVSGRIREAPTVTRRILLLGLLAMLASAAGPAFAGNLVTDLPAYHVADPSAPEVTAKNLLESERFWPYRVSLVKDWQPDAESPVLETGIGGVLVRVEDSDRARIDFGRYGIHEAPLDVTDILELANAIREGSLDKSAPNFAFAIIPRLADPSGPTLIPVRYRQAADHRAFLCVFVEESGFDFVALATALAPLQDREGLLTVVFPQARGKDRRIREELRDLGWTVPFAFDQFSEPYTLSLIGPDATLPTLLLVSPEGRELFRTEWQAGALRRLGEAIEAELGEPERADGD